MPAREVGPDGRYIFRLRAMDDDGPSLAHSDALRRAKMARRPHSHVHCNLLGFEFPAYTEWYGREAEFQP